MFDYSVEQWLFFFYIYCFFGGVFESTYVSLKSHHFVNRGFMHGPFLPLYGTGAIMMLVVSRPFADNLVLTYAAGCVGATVLEYLTGAWMEAMFKVRYWDYSDKRFNVKGYICLGSSLTWGLLTILMTRVVHTPVESLMLSIPPRLLIVLVLALTVYIAIDLVLSFRDAFALRDVLVRLEKVRQEASLWQEKLAEAVDVAQEQLSERKEKYTQDLEQWKENLPKPDVDLEQWKEKLSKPDLEQWREKLLRLELDLAQLKERLPNPGLDMEQRKGKLLPSGLEPEQWKERLSQYLPDAEGFKETMQKRGVDPEQIFKRIENTRSQYAELKERISGMSLHPLKDNPTLSSRRFAESLKELREELKRNKEDGKDGAA
ncbi:MAG: hypothetical protein LUE87_02960 [Lachnospiraceae bacterium]|nr:hypothetical protein [Lachnospiraceae bacterium]